MDNMVNNNREDCICLETVTEMLRLRNGIERVLSPITQRYGLTPMQTAALHFISANSEATVGNIFRSFELNQGNASSMCKKLEAEGYIIRRRSFEDERFVMLELTDRGREVMCEIEKKSKVLIHLSDEFSTDERLRIADSLTTIKDFAARLSNILTNLENNEEKVTNA